MIKLTIQVADIANVLLMYNQIRIYTSDAENGVYTYLTSLSLMPGVSTYTYSHAAGTSDTWYKSSYYNSSNMAESSLSNAAQGESPSLYHVVTYPEECEFDGATDLLIRKIRRLIGDLKGLKRLYECDGEFCSSIHADEHTIELDQKGWPVSVSIDGVEYTSLYDPVVQGYQFLTFSGALVSGSQTACIDIWYYTFLFSDREIYEAYSDAMIPPLVPIDCVTDDHLILQASIDLLESVALDDLINDGAVIRDDQTLYDPSPGLRNLNSSDGPINRLRKQLDDLIKECIRSSLHGSTGYLID
jgi:hypothetical protein